jgi:hypothetical protein
MRVLRDSIGRRKRWTPIATRARYRPTERGIIMMEKLHRHGALPSSFLHAYCVLEGYRNRGRTLDNLTNLYNESQTPHGGRYLDRPFQQAATFDARYQEIMYEIAAPGLEALAERGLYHKYAPVPSNNHWIHDAFCSAFTASIELAVLAEPERYEYIFHDEIVERLGGHFLFEVAGEELEPDRSFGIRYKPSGGARIFLLEADRGTETNTTKSKKPRKTQDKSIRLYNTFIGQGAYQKYFPQGTRLMLIRIFSSPPKMEHVRDMTGNCTFTLFQSWPTFTRFFKPPLPKLDFFTGPYLRAGHPAFFINHV